MSYFLRIPPQPKVYTQTSDSVNDVQMLEHQVASRLASVPSPLLPDTFSDLRATT